MRIDSPSLVAINMNLSYQLVDTASPRQLSYGQTLRDRAYLAFSASRTF